ncbi:DUF192 domain-containing protein [Maricaulaceae bacterium MS644]
MENSFHGYQGCIINISPSLRDYNLRRIDVITAQIVFSSPNGSKSAPVQVEIAESQAEKETGLSNRRSLAPGAGFYLPSRPAAPARLWMLDALIALDIIFIGVDDVVTGVIQAAPPGGERMYWSPGFVSGVLEVNAGDAARLGLTAGARLEWT